MAVPAPSAHPGPREPTYFEHPLDDTVHNRPFRPRPRPGPPSAVVATVIVLVIVLAAAFVYSIRGGLHGVLPSSNGAETVIPFGTVWPLSAQGQGYEVQQFQASANGTLYGNFTSGGQETYVLLLNESQMANFTGNLSSPELYSTGGVHIGGMQWGIGVSGAYFLVGLNQEVTPVSLTWVTAVQYLP